MTEGCVPVPASELARLRAVEDAASWHLAHSACAGWAQGEVLALALGLDPDAPMRMFRRLADAMGVELSDADKIPDRWLIDRVDEK